jgi:hypothetical protein
MSRKKPPRRPQCRHLFLGIQPTRLNVHSYFREWSCSGLRSTFVSACEAEKRFFPVVPFFCYRDGTIRFLKLTSLTVIHLMSGNAWSYLRHVAYGFLRLSEGA